MKLFPCAVEAMIPSDTNNVFQQVSFGHGAATELGIYLGVKRRCLCALKVQAVDEFTKLQPDGPALPTASGVGADACGFAARPVCECAVGGSKQSFCAVRRFVNF